MMSERIYLNNDWKFAEQFEASMTERRFTILMNTAIRWSAVIEE